MAVMEFKEFIERQFVQWQSEQGQRKSVADYAAFLGVSQPLLSMWLNGSRRPGSESLRVLYPVFGPSVYDVLGLPRPNPRHAYVSRNWERLPIKEQKKIADIIARYTTEPVPAVDEPERRTAKT